MKRRRKHTGLCLNSSGPQFAHLENILFPYLPPDGGFEKLRTLGRHWASRMRDAIIILEWGPYPENLPKCDLSTKSSLAGPSTFLCAPSDLGAKLLPSTDPAHRTHQVGLLPLESPPSFPLLVPDPFLGALEVLILLQHPPTPCYLDESLLGQPPPKSPRLEQVFSPTCPHVPPQLLPSAAPSFR